MNRRRRYLAKRRRAAREVGIAMRLWRFAPEVAAELQDPTPDDYKRAGELLDAQPCPTKGRLYYDPETDTVKQVEDPSGKHQD